MDGRPTWTDCDEAGDYVVPNVLSPRDLVFRPDMDETVPHLIFDVCAIQCSNTHVHQMNGKYQFISLRSTCMSITIHYMM